jgi:hypothetical protein
MAPWFQCVRHEKERQSPHGRDGHAPFFRAASLTAFGVAPVIENPTGQILALECPPAQILTGVIHGADNRAAERRRGSHFPIRSDMENGNHVEKT